jgi:hypothetical protein
MMKNETQSDRIAAMGRKPVRDLVAGDEFTHSIFGECTFLRWRPYGEFFGNAVVWSNGDHRFITLNTAGSVKML